MTNSSIKMLIFAISGENSIDESYFNIVESQLNNITGDSLYFVIHTDGGIPYSAVKIMMLLQSKFKKIYSIIPIKAMSAGTLMVLGTDEIYMYEKSMLGPLDLPIEHPDDGSRISSLDVQNAVTSIGGLASSLAKEWYSIMRRNCRLGKDVAAKIALEKSVELLKPLIEQIDPYHLQKSYRESKIAWWYSYDLLMSRMIKSSNKAWSIARRLVSYYPAHEYSIFKYEAKTLGLNVKDLSGCKEWDLIKPKFESKVVNKTGYDDNEIISYEEIPYGTNLSTTKEKPKK